MGAGGEILSGREAPVVARPGPDPTIAGDRADLTAVTSRVVTLPNLLSVLRLLGVPVFLYLVLVAKADLAAVVLLIVSGVSDWLDGMLARAWGQISRIGQLLDPLADRLYIFATVVAFGVREVIPWWFVALILCRDAVLTGAVLLLRRYGYRGLPVHYLGKAATANLLYAFPLLLLATVPGLVGAVAGPVGWAFAIWGAGLYWWAAGLYLGQAVALLRAARREVSV